MKLSIALAGLLLLPILAPCASVAAATPRIVTGDVIANRTVALSTRIMGRITQVHAKEGDAVASGKVIVEIDDTPYLAQLRVAEAVQERAQAELAHRQRIHKRLQTLSQTNTASQEALDQATYGLEVAEANLRMARAEIEGIQSTLSETRIKVPFDAIVIKKFAETGLVTQPGQALYEVQDQSKLKFRARVKERDLAHIKVNDKARISITALGDEPITATVITVIPYGDNRHTFIIELALPDSPGLYPGMFGKAVFE